MTNIEGLPPDEWALRVDETVDWEKSLTAQIVANITYYRDARKLTTAELARLCTKLGYAVKRTALASLLVGRRQSVTVQELLVIAKALDVPMTYLLFPIHSRAEAMLTPGDIVHPYFAANAVSGVTRRTMRFANTPAYDNDVTAMTHRMDLFVSWVDMVAMANERLALASHKVAMRSDLNDSDDDSYLGEKVDSLLNQITILSSLRVELLEAGVNLPLTPEAQDWPFLANGHIPFTVPMLEILPSSITDELFPLYVFESRLWNSAAHSSRLVTEMPHHHNFTKSYASPADAD